MAATVSAMARHRSAPGAPLGLGIAGLGTAGAAMLAAALHHGGVRVAAVADPVVDDLPIGALGAGAHRTLDALLEDPAVEAVHLATPTPLHAAHVRAAVAAGRHVIVEKPVTTHSGEVAALAEAAAAAGVAVIVGHSESFEPYVRAARAAIDTGEVGDVVHVAAEKVTDWLRRPRRPDELDPASGGGIVRRQGVHQVDVVRSLVPGAGFEVCRARLHGGGRLRVPAGYVAWLEEPGAVTALLLQDGTGVRVAAGPDARPEGPQEAEKRRRTRAWVERAVSGGGPLRLGRHDTERLAVLGSEGFLVGSSAGVVVERGGDVVERDLGAWPDGRMAVLDELLAVLDGDRAFHDLAWGAENLRLCEAIDRLGSA